MQERLLRGAGRPGQQKIIWHGCRTGPGDGLGAQLDAAGARCAEVTVPLDRARPDGRTIKVAISRLQATDPGHRRGALLVNPGGPGDPGRIYAPLLKAAAPALAARYDLIGMDPRFTGRSTPVNCRWPIGDYLRSTGPDRRAFDRIAAQAEDLAARCAGQRELLPHASARATARDTDVIRAALGEPKLSYLGGSYGTYLGAVYLQLFPGRADRPRPGHRAPDRPGRRPRGRGHPDPLPGGGADVPVLPGGGRSRQRADGDHLRGRAGLP
ncbi:alpha/beta fold hydrolase [Planomonospora corallina]|uniref:Alpha/beta fold hydrolase n=1 Tax=Planomonospora corallina TaxID=1806052 RepID=A0ABV8IBP7_9ACTN